MTTKIRTEPMLSGQGLRIVLDDPKGNVLDGVMMASLNELFDSLQGRPELKLLCFTGAGDHFSFGASVPDHVGPKAGAMLAGFHGMFLRLVKLAIPTVAAVKGRCLGGGMEVAIFCNRVIAAPTATFGQPEIQLAVLPPLASLVLPLKIGQSKADDLVITGRSITGAEAKDFGLVDQLADDPVAAAEEWATKELLPKSASSLRWAVRSSRHAFNQQLTTGIPALEKMYLEQLMATHDANEGLAAFLEKRKPVWTNN
ncbi:MAG: enoyl-CoA hydratase/isomerase family protein [Deltaproteobacteria bacterium]|nr:enoyl-CoA hydratase/isomerase family protein [Deltaproteobacteria bacterium]